MAARGSKLSGRRHGYRSLRNLATIIYLIAGKLDLPLTHLQ
jgi:hypothetical protein